MSRPIRAVIHPQQQAWIDEQVARYRDVLMRSCAEAVVIAREEAGMVDRWDMGSVSPWDDLEN